jgi:hypothetical protein
MGVPYKFNRIQALVEYHDLLAQAFSDIGYKVVLTPIPIQSSHEMLISGTVDSVSYDDLVDQDGRENIVTTSFPVAITTGTIFYAKIRPINAEKLHRYRGAISKNNHAIIREAKKQKLRFIETSNPFHCIQTIVEKKADYCISIREIGISAMNAIPEAKGRIVYADQPFVKVPVHISLKKKYEKDLPKLEAALKERLRGDLSKYPTITPALNTHP